MQSQLEGIFPEMLVRPSALAAPPLSPFLLLPFFPFLTIVEKQICFLRAISVPDRNDSCAELVVSAKSEECFAAVSWKLTAPQDKVCRGGSFGNICFFLRSGDPGFFSGIKAVK